MSVSLRQLPTLLLASGLLLASQAAHAYDDDDHTYRIIGFTAGDRHVVYEESFSRGHIGGGYVRLVLFSAKTGKKIRHVTIAELVVSPEDGKNKVLVSEATGERRRKAFLRRYKPRPGKALTKIKGLALTFEETGPQPALPAYHHELTGKESRRVTRSFRIKRAGRTTVLRKTRVGQTPVINSHTGIPSWAVMSLKSGQLSPGGKVLALVMDTGDADRDTEPRVFRMPKPARKNKAANKPPIKP
jgi:hypothetical protein